MTPESFLHVGAVSLPVVAGIVGWFLRTMLAQMSTRLEKIETKLDVASEHRGEMRALLGQLGVRLDRVEAKQDNVA